MRACPTCGRGVEDAAQFCPGCGNPIAVVSGASVAAGGYGGPVETSGKAIASLVCGILFFIFPSAIVAIVMGHISLSDIKRSGGRLGGKGLAITGTVLGYVGVAFIPVMLIIAAIAIPNLLRAKMAANEATAVGSLRTINTACVMYADEYKTMPAELVNLGPAIGSGPDREHSGQLGESLVSGSRSGYMISYRAGRSQAGGVVTEYKVYADPLNPGVTGMKHFYSDQTGVIRWNARTSATEASPALE